MRVHGVLVTYRRPDDLARTLEMLSGQTRPVDTLTIVDNDPDRSAAPSAHGTRYLAPGNNLGPAGAFVLAIESLKDEPAEDWVLLLDDDDPPSSPTAFEGLVARAAQLPEDVAGTGLVGARYRRRLGQLVRVPDDELHGAVEVDCIGGGQLPIYRMSALRQIAPRSDLFFGFDDLDVGRRLRRAGWRLLIDGDSWRSLRTAKGRGGLSTRDIRSSSKVSDWRRYYSARNLVLIARDECWSAALVTVAMNLGRAVALLRTNPKQASATLSGTMHGILGRAGRIVDPPY